MKVLERQSTDQKNEAQAPNFSIVASCPRHKMSLKTFKKVLQTFGLVHNRSSHEAKVDRNPNKFRGE